MIIAEVAVFPTSEGSSVSRYVKEVLRVLEASGLEIRTVFDSLKNVEKQPLVQYLGVRE